MGAACVSWVLAIVGLALKMSDIGMPIIATAMCFPDSATPPYVNHMSGLVCYNASENSTHTRENEPCPFGDFFALYAIYCVMKVTIGVVDVIVCTPMLFTKTSEWYL